MNTLARNDATKHALTNTKRAEGPAPCMYKYNNWVRVRVRVRVRVTPNLRAKERISPLQGAQQKIMKHVARSMHDSKGGTA